MEKRRRCGDDDDGDDDEDHLLPKGLITMEKKERCGDPTFKFGCFILLATNGHTSFPDHNYSIEHALFMLSSESSSESLEDDSGSGGCLWSTGSKDDYDDDKVFKVDIDNNNNQRVFKLDSFGFPLDYKVCKHSKRIVGSCNGLVCLLDIALNQVSLWNPVTRHFRFLPKTFIPNKDNFGPLPSLFAFCFDVETKDYKVVLLTRLRPTFYRPVSPIECRCRVQVYSLSTNSWRLLEGITSLPGDPFPYSDQVLYLNGSCCFFMARFFHTKQQPCLPENNRFIISFDFTKEIITPIQLPDHHQDQVLYLSSLGDKMALFTVSYKPPRGTYHPEICGCEDYDIWVLDEHVRISSISSSNVNKRSWRKFYSFQIEHQKSGERSRPRGISDDAEFALLQIDSPGFGKKMQLYNFATNKVKKDFLPCTAVLAKAFAFKPSPDSIIGGEGEEEAAAVERLIGNGATNL